MKSILAIVLACTALAASALAPPLPERTPAPAGAEVYFIAPSDGATVGKRFVVRFGLKGMGVAPAGIQVANTGHHHLLVDLDELPAMDHPLANDAHHRHFGAGQTEVELELPPGQHTLQLLVGDYLHLPHDPPILSPRITVTVE